MFKVKIGDKLRIDEVKVGGVKVRSSVIGKVIKEYDYHFTLSGVNYLFSLNKNCLIDNSLQIRKIRTKVI